MDISDTFQHHRFRLTSFYRVPKIVQIIGGCLPPIRAAMSRCEVDEGLVDAANVLESLGKYADRVAEPDIDAGQHPGAGIHLVFRIQQGSSIPQ